MVGRNIIDANVDIMVLCWSGVNMDAIIQKAQRSIVNYKSVSTVFLKTLSGGRYFVI